MTFVPSSPAQFIRPIRNNTKRIIERDQAEVIAAIQAEFGLASLPIIAEFKTALSPNQNLPTVTILPGATIFDDDQDGRAQWHTFEVEIELSNTDPEEAEDQGLAYVCAMDRILTTAQRNDFTFGAAQPGRVYAVLVTKHDYGIYGKVNNGYLARNPGLSFKVKTTEA